MPAESTIRALSDRQIAQRIGRLAQDIFAVSIQRSVLALTFLVLSSLTEGVSIIVLVPVLELINHRSQGPATQTPGDLSILNFTGLGHLGLVGVLGVFTALACLSALFSRFKTVYMAALLLDAVNRLRMILFDSVAAARWSAVAKLRISDLDHVLTGDIDRVQAAATAIFLVVQAAVFLILYGAISSTISFKMTALAGVAGILMFVALYSLRRRGVIFGDQLTRERQQQYRTIGDFLASLKVTKSFNAEAKYSAELKSVLERLKARTLEFVRLTTFGGALFQCLGVMAGCAFIYASYAIYGVSLSRIIVLILIFTRVVPRFKDIQDQSQTIITNLPAYENMRTIRDYCELERETDGSATAATVPTFAREVRFESVDFSYGDQPTIQHLNIVIPYGQVTALVGPSGSGKSTIADLAMGLQFAGNGKVTIDGTELTEQNSRAWRAQIAYVPQETFLIAGSIEANVNIAAHSVPSAQVQDALGKAHAWDFIEGLPQGASTLVGDGGLKLSGGERQRIAIARALLKKPKLIIMDEPTSALDGENTAKVIETIGDLRGKTTVLLVTHNPVVQACADNVIRLSNGQVV